MAWSPSSKRYVLSPSSEIGSTSFKGFGEGDCSDLDEVVDSPSLFEPDSFLLSGMSYIKNNEQGKSEYPLRDIENIELFYTYSSSYLSDRSKNLDDINSKLTTVLGFSGLLLRFCMDLPDGCRSCRYTKILAIALSGVASYVCCSGITARDSGKVPYPLEIITTYFKDEAVKTKARMGQNVCKAAEDVQRACDKKAALLNKAIWLTGSAAGFFAINGILAALLHNECIWPK